MRSWWLYSLGDHHAGSALVLASLLKSVAKVEEQLFIPFKMQRKKS